MSWLDNVPPDDPWSKDYHEPKKLERVWYRHTTTGERGWKVRRDGKTKVRRDLGPEIDQCLPFNKRDWAPMKELRPLTGHHLGEISYSADRVLVKALDGRSPPEWLNLSDTQKIDFKDNGPPADAEPERMEVFRVIQKALEHLKA